MGSQIGLVGWIVGGNGWLAPCEVLGRRHPDDHIEAYLINLNWIGQATRTSKQAQQFNGL